MKKQTLVIGVVLALVLLGGSFYGGMQYGARNTAAKSQSTAGGRNFGGAIGAGQRGAAGQGMQSGSQRSGANTGGGFTVGQIVSKDDTSVTVKTNDGGSKIIFFSSSTSIDKSVSGASSDLSVGQQITANGKINPDGSVVAQNIQIRPTQPAQPVKQ